MKQAKVQDVWFMSDSVCMSCIFLYVCLRETVWGRDIREGRRDRKIISVFLNIVVQKVISVV